MSAPLSAADFLAFFEAVHGHPPFPWQKRLAEHLADGGSWPSVLDLPTGSGKTAAIDIAVFHLALEAQKGQDRNAPVRIAFVVDRRLVVDDAHLRAEKIADALAAADPDTVLGSVAQRLQCLAGKGEPPLVVRRLRGGIPREPDWARTPAQPTVLCSTVDQVGSRLLFRGYGVSDTMKPVHAGLIGSDCLILLDEAHLAEPFRQTLGWVKTYRNAKWRAPETHAAPWSVALLTATPKDETAVDGDEPASDTFSLDDRDRTNPILLARLEASKPARLIGPAKAKAGDAAEAEDEAEEADSEQKEMQSRVTAIVEQVKQALAHFAKSANGAQNPAVAVVVNRVARARQVFERLKREVPGVVVDDVAPADDSKGTDRQSARLVLLIGPSRSADREQLVREALAPIRTGEERTLPHPIVIVATQTIEAGVDIDLDGLITEAAPLDALRQRFGRLNRAGREIEPYAAIVAAKGDIASRADDPVYGRAIKAAWDYLSAAAMPGGKGEPPVVDFGLKAFGELQAAHPPEKDPVSPAYPHSPKPGAPILMPAHLDLLSQTFPIPAADPEVALYLHGPGRSTASVSVLWRADIEPPVAADSEEASRRTQRLMLLVPPRSGEVIELPLWSVKRWLGGDSRYSELADLAEREPEEEARPRSVPKGMVFRWAGDSERSGWIRPSGIKPGDTIVAPARYGGVDRFGWNPASTDPATDVADRAAEPFAGRRFAVRVAPGLLEESTEPRDGETAKEAEARQAADARRAMSRKESLAATLAELRGTKGWRAWRDRIADLDLPRPLGDALKRLDDAKGGRNRIEVYADIYGTDADGKPAGMVFVAPKGVRKAAGGAVGSTEDDIAGSLPGFPLSLPRHNQDVSEMAQDFARAAGLPPDRVSDLTLAGALHDLGKADPRFQAWMHSGDPLDIDLDDPERILAKSGRRLPRDAHEKAGLPERWRHEALSVRLAIEHEDFASAADADLVLWLVGTHHGRGRPLFPHADRERDAHVWADVPRLPGLPERLEAGHGPQSLAFDWQGLDWPGLFQRLKARYGAWELARMEAILRLADHRASEEAALLDTEQAEDTTGTEKAA